MAETGTDIYKAADILQSGGLVAIPTETVYGLAANALDKSAVVKIFEAKNRPFFDPLIVHTFSIESCKKYIEEFPATALRAAELLWPGPLTIVLKKNDIIPEIVTAGNDSVGLRIPRHPLTLKLLEILPFPLAAPSANPFGYISPTSAAHVNDQLGEKIDYIIDGGPCEVGLESTIIRFRGEIPEVLRLGGTAPEKLKEIFGDISEFLTQNSNPTAPGQLDKHYSPHSKMVLIPFESKIPDSFLKMNFATLQFSAIKNNIPRERQFILSATGNLEEAAMNLFDFLRRLDEKKYEIIIAELVPEVGLGRAINDRLKRAAAK